MKKYGNNIHTIKRVSKIGALFSAVVFVLLFVVAYFNNNLRNTFPTIIGISLSVGLIIPLFVSITTILNIEINDNNICLLVLGKFRFNSRPIDRISSISIRRGLFFIKFDDGSAICTLGMYIPEYYKLIHDIRSSSTKEIIINSDWFVIEEKQL